MDTQSSIKTLLQHDTCLVQESSRNLVASFFWKLCISIVRVDYWQSEINNNGIEIKKLWKSSKITIPWEQIQCIDLSGLEKKDSTYRTVFSSRVFRKENIEYLMKSCSVMIMSENSELIKSLCHFTFGKTSMQAANVFSIINLDRKNVSALKEKIKFQARAHNIKLDRISLDF